jgi:hypothetical protein
LVALALLGWRTVATARRREVEVAYWVWAAVSFAPISQIFPFLYPLADRYLYFILPGLLGGALLMALDASRRIADERTRTNAGYVALAIGLGLCVAFGVHSHRRAGLWRYAATLTADAARHYPNGVSANLRRSQQAARLGNGPEAAAALEAAFDRGFNRFEMIYSDPSWDPVRTQPDFAEVFAKIARSRIEKVASRDDPTQGELRMAGHAYIALGEYAEARRVLKQALAVGGILDDEIRRDLSQLAHVLD